MSTPPRNIAAIEAWCAHTWNDAPNRRARFDPRDDYDPTPPDTSDPRNEGADAAEARETAWREGR